MDDGFGWNQIVDMNPAQKTQYIFHCGVCGAFPRGPATIGCRHVICWKCALKLLEFADVGEDAKCPFCRNTFSNFTLQKGTGSNRLMHDYCQHKIRCSCGKEADPKEMHNHQVAQCPLRIVPCPTGRCRPTLPFFEMRIDVAEQHKDSRKEMGDMLLAQLTDSMDHLTFEVTPKG